MDATTRVRDEQRGLVVSLVAAAVLGAVGVVWGVLAGAGVLVFDGVFTLAGTALSAGSLLAAKVADSPPSKGYPFGRSAAVPVTIAVQGVALATTLLYAAVDAVRTILDGGSGAAQTALVAYGLVSTAASLVVILVLGRLAGGSELVGAEVASWRAGVVLSALVAVGGCVGLVLEARGWTTAGSYVDPVLVLVAVASTAAIPVRLIRTSLHELLEGAPPPEVTARIDATVAAVRHDHGLPRAVVRSTKLGKRLYVEVDFVVGKDTWTVDSEDEVRRAVVHGLEDLPYEVWVTAEVTTDPGLL
jgi:predicted Co/Zn/Cd cation transporter (cation efflux family)